MISRFNQRALRFLSSFLLGLVLLPGWPSVAAHQPTIGLSQNTPSAASADLIAQLAAIEKKIDDQRKELGIPGVALAIVKDDKIIYLKGLGLRDIEKKLPVTPETLFAIGSSTKAFTAMATAMSIDDGKMAWEDSPKKFIPYFKLQDPEADAKITIRDLLCHNSGLSRTDLLWYTGVLNSQEVIQAVSAAKPRAKFREKFQYQNVMFLAAGECVAAAQHTSYDAVLKERIFKPLGMNATTLSVPEMKKARDRSLGYIYVPSVKKTSQLPTRDLKIIAPAGAINSNARDMAQWVRLMLNGGEWNGKRLVSEASFAELVKLQTKIQGPVNYGLGWFLRDWRGHKVVEHGGNIDGFNAQVALMPDQKLGFVLLTNVSASPLGAIAMESVWSNLVEGGTPPASATASSEPTGDPKQEAGTYELPGGAELDVAFKDGKLVLTVPGQPSYPLANLSGRRYKLESPAPDGFFATFRAVKDKPGESEIYLEQPNGNFAFPKRKTSGAGEEVNTLTLAETFGSYNHKESGLTIDLAAVDNKVMLTIPGQSPYALKATSTKDSFGLKGLPDVFNLTFRRGADGKITGALLKQPQGDLELVRMSGGATIPTLTVDELMAKVIDAIGGEATLTQHKTMVTRGTLNLESQGFTGKLVTKHKSPNLWAESTTFHAIGKTIGATEEYFDGTAGAGLSSFAEPDTYVGKKLTAVRLAAELFPELKWKTLYKTVTLKGIGKVNDEDVYIVVKTPEGSDPITEYISAKTFLILRQDVLQTSDSSERIAIPATILFEDYRTVNGIKVPFKTTQRSAEGGDIVFTLDKISFDEEIPDSFFQTYKKKKKATGWLEKTSR